MWTATPKLISKTFDGKSGIWTVVLEFSGDAGELIRRLTYTADALKDETLAEFSARGFAELSAETDTDTSTIAVGDSIDAPTILKARDAAIATQKAADAAVAAAQLAQENPAP